MSTFLLIDGHSQAYRAYFGVKTPLVTARGEMTSAVFGFVRKLFSILREYQPDGVAVAFDRGSTWRHEEFAQYKATRDAMPDDMKPQLERIEQILEALHIPIITKENYEADDVLGALAKQAADNGHDVLILTGDRDMFQLVTDRIRILYTSGGPSPVTKPYGVVEVAARYDGLTPDQFLDMKALAGDSSDNIPGVSGVGEKTAIKFLKEYGSLDGLYAHIDQVRRSKLQQNLRDAEADVHRSKRLMTIISDLDVTFDAERFSRQEYDSGAIRRLFEELEFRSFLRELELLDEDIHRPTEEGGQLTLFAQPATPTLIEEHPYHCIQTAADLSRLVEMLDKAEILAFDVETTGPDPMRAMLVGLGIAWAKGEAAYIPVAHSSGQQLPWATVRDALQPCFSRPNLLKVTHNGKYDLMVCQRHELHVAAPLHDTMLIAWLLNPASRSLGLKSQAEVELGWSMTEITALIGRGRKQITIDQVDLQQVTAYCGADVDATFHLWEVLVPRLQEAGMWPLYEEIELPLLPVLAAMEMAGIRLNTEFLAELSQKLGTRLREIEGRLKEIVGHEFNLRSTQQLSTVMFQEMEFPAMQLKKTRSGFVSTAIGELEKLRTASAELSAEQIEFLDLLFEQRQLEKLRSTYVDTLGELVDGRTRRLHTSYNQTGSSTGRLSSSNPNLQNIPIRTQQGRDIRRAFEASAGHMLLAADYSQVELRILAHVVQEELLLAAFRQGQDIHAVTASRLFDVPLAQVSYEQRSLGKTINFATIYGISAFGLSSRTGMDPAEAQVFLDQYFATYPQVRQYIDETIQEARTDGYVKTLLGRKRFFPELKRRLPFNQRQALERQAINAPIQGTAADIIKIAMIDLHHRLRDADLQAKMLLQVHDELVLEVPDKEQDTVAHLVREVMESAYSLDVPLQVDIEVGANWYDMEHLYR